MKDTAQMAEAARVAFERPLRASPHGTEKKKQGFFVVCVNTNYPAADNAASSARVAQQLNNLAALRCSLEKVGSTMERYAVTYGYDAATRAALTSEGWRVIDVSRFDMRPYYKPMFSMSASQKARRPSSIRYRGNSSAGWDTYYKFLLWNMTQFDKILYSDAEVLFMQNPDTWFERADYPYGFLSDTEELERGWLGLNTHMMLLRPDPDVFELLLVKAKEGKYITFANTEQDVLETVFAVDSALITTEGDIMVSDKMGAAHFYTYGKAPFPEHYYRAHVSHPAKLHDMVSAATTKEYKYWESVGKTRVVDCKAHAELVSKYIGKDKVRSG